LNAIFKIVDNSSVVADKIYLSAEQKILLQLSEDDIKENRIISETEMNKSDLKWLRLQTKIND